MKAVGAVEGIMLVVVLMAVWCTLGVAGHLHAEGDHSHHHHHPDGTCAHDHHHDHEDDHTHDHHHHDHGEGSDHSSLLRDMKKALHSPLLDDSANFQIVVVDSIEWSKATPKVKTTGTAGNAAKDGSAAAEGAAGARTATVRMGGSMREVVLLGGQKGGMPYYDSATAKDYWCWFPQVQDATALQRQREEQRKKFNKLLLNVREDLETELRTRCFVGPFAEGPEILQKYADKPTQTSLHSAKGAAGPSGAGVKKAGRRGKGEGTTTASLCFSDELKVSNGSATVKFGAFPKGVLLREMLLSDDGNDAGAAGHMLSLQLNEGGSPCKPTTHGGSKTGARQPADGGDKFRTVITFHCDADDGHGKGGGGFMGYFPDVLEESEPTQWDLLLDEGRCAMHVALSVKAVCPIADFLRMRHVKPIICQEQGSQKKQGVGTSGG